MNPRLEDRSQAAAHPDLAGVPDLGGVIETARLRLRPHVLSDADAIALSLGDHAVSRMLARVPSPYDRSDAFDWLDGLRQAKTPDRVWAVTLVGDRHIGCVGIELLHGQWHLGYWLNRQHWNRGYGSEAVRAAVLRFFQDLPDAVLLSGAFAENTASLRLQAKLGFEIVGRSDLYALARNAMVPHIETRLMAGGLRAELG